MSVICFFYTYLGYIPYGHCGISTSIYPSRLTRFTTVLQQVTVFFKWKSIISSRDKLVVKEGRTISSIQREFDLGNGTLNVGIKNILPYFQITRNLILKNSILCEEKSNGEKIYPFSLQKLKEKNHLLHCTPFRVKKHLNNIIDQDHQFIKKASEICLN